MKRYLAGTAAGRVASAVLAAWAIAGGARLEAQQVDQIPGVQNDLRAPILPSKCGTS